MADVERFKAEGFSAGLELRCVGVLALFERGRVVYVIGSKNLWTVMAGLFKTKRRKGPRGNTKLGVPWVDAKEFEFDEILIRYCYLDEIGWLAHDLIERYRPEHNISLRPTRVKLGLDELNAITGLNLVRKEPRPIRRLRL